jgi:hypothetical protein
MHRNALEFCSVPHDDFEAGHHREGALCLYRNACNGWSRRLFRDGHPLSRTSLANGGFGRQLPHDISWIRLEMEASGWRST